MAKVVFLGAGEGRLLVVGPNTTTLKAVTDDTEGRFSVIEGQLDAHFPGPPVHVHDQLDHAIYVLEGTVVLTVEQRQLTAPAGSFALIPHGIAHTFANPSDTAARFVEVDAPAGFERYFERLAEAVPAGSQLDPATMAASRPSTIPTHRTPDPLSRPGRSGPPDGRRQRSPPPPLVAWSAVAGGSSGRAYRVLGCWLTRRWST
jgi:mannose-6-phosphate isomerase-like protein (cupin superfamily)